MISGMILMAKYYNCRVEGMERMAPGMVVAVAVVWEHEKTQVLVRKRACSTEGMVRMIPNMILMEQYYNYTAEGIVRMVSDMVVAVAVVWEHEKIQVVVRTRTRAPVRVRVL
jgi:hypothetical protein